VLLPLPHVLGSAINISYNSLRLELEAPQKAAFLWVLFGYNAVVYPLCLWLFFRQWVLVYRTWKRLARPGPIDPEEVDGARRRARKLKQVGPAELAREEGSMRVLMGQAVLSPLAGASLLLGVDPNEFDLSASGDYLTFRLLVIALMAAGALGLGIAILAAAEL